MLLPVAGDAQPVRALDGADDELVFDHLHRDRSTGELIGDSKRVAADHYVYALTDYREVDRTIAIARTRA